MLLERMHTTCHDQHLILLDCLVEEDPETTIRLAVSSLRKQLQRPELLIKKVVNPSLQSLDETQIAQVDQALVSAGISDPEPRKDLINFASDLSNRFNLSLHSRADLYCVFDSGLRACLELAKKWHGNVTPEVIRHIRRRAVGRRPDHLFTYGLEALPDEEQHLWVSETASATVADGVTHLQAYRQKEAAQPPGLMARLVII